MNDPNSSILSQPCTGDKKLDRFALFLAETIHREAVQTRLILETILAQLMAITASDPALEATLARVKASTKTAIAHGKIADAETKKLSNPEGIESPGANAQGAD
jgi:hypothetical protein